MKVVSLRSYLLDFRRHVTRVSLEPQLALNRPTTEVLGFAREHGVVTTLGMIATRRGALLAVLELRLLYFYFMPGLDEAQLIGGLEQRKDVIAFFRQGHSAYRRARRGRQRQSGARRGRGCLPQTYQS